MEDQNSTKYIAAARIDQKENKLITIEKGLIADIPAVDLVTGIITYATQTTVGSFYLLDPKEFWAPRKKEIRFPSDYPKVPERGWKPVMVVNPEDGYLYTHYFYGDLVRIDPKTYEAKLIHKTPQGGCRGMTFIPQEPNILYLSFVDNAGVNAHAVCSIDVSAAEPGKTFKKLSGATGGFRDGPLDAAQFKNPSQMMSDSDGNIYIADDGNHCIRRITPDKIVETVLGFPQTPGFKDGGKEEALFKNPTGIGIGKDGAVYVADNGNCRVRKLTIN
jgi:streptogramin lyase